MDSIDIVGLGQIYVSQNSIKIILVLIGLVLSLIVKDLIQTFVSGLLFRINKNFNEGDVVFLDGEKSIIIRIGFRQTVFQTNRENEKVWKFIYNDRIKYHNLEKIIDA
jgi:small-conductance mechanosensitive channel